jgi:hypothetical protein
MYYLTIKDVMFSRFVSQSIATLKFKEAEDILFILSSFNSTISLLAHGLDSEAATFSDVINSLLVEYIDNARNFICSKYGDM